MVQTKEVKCPKLEPKWIRIGFTWYVIYLRAE